MNEADEELCIWICYWTSRISFPAGSPTESLNYMRYACRANRPYVNISRSDQLLYPVTHAALYIYQSLRTNNSEYMSSENSPSTACFFCFSRRFWNHARSRVALHFYYKRYLLSDEPWTKDHTCTSPASTSPSLAPQSKRPPPPPPPLPPGFLHLPSTRPYLYLAWFPLMRGRGSARRFLGCQYLTLSLLARRCRR